PDVVDREHGQEDRGPREDRPVRGEVQVVLDVEQDPSPRGNVGWKPETQEGQRRLRDDRRRDVDGGGHQHRTHRVRQTVAEHLTEGRRPETARRLDELLLAERQELGAHQARDRHPAQAPDDRDDQDEYASLRAERLPQRVAEEVDDQQQQGEPRERQEHVGDAHQRVVDLAAHEPRRRANRGPDRDRDQHRRDPHGERDAASIEHARQQILAEVVGAERVAPGRALELGLEVDFVDRVAPHQWTGQYREHHRHQDDAADHGEVVATETASSLEPQRGRYVGRGADREDGFGRAPGRHYR